MASSQIDEIKSRLNIVDVVQNYIKLYKAGANYRANCPFHSEKKPSFFVSPSRQIWHCFGSCSEGGDIFKFVMKVEGVEFGDALRILAQKAGVELVRQDPKLKTERHRSFEISETACRFFQAQLENSQTGKEAKKYLQDRGLKEETIGKWRLGYSPDSWNSLSDFLVGRGYKREEIVNAGLALKSEKSGDYYDRFRGRIMFPIFNISSQPVGFGGRVFKNLKRQDGQDEAKYINIPNTLIYDKSRILFGLNNAGIEARKKDFCIMVEGYIDAIMTSQAGFENVVATSGTALTNYQLDILKRYTDNLFMSFDMDLAGDSATKRGIDLAQAAGFNIKIITMPENPEAPGTVFKDPADAIFKNPVIFENCVKNAKTIHDFYFDSVLARFDKNSMEGKKKISKTLLPVIKKIPDKIEQSLWIQRLANILGVKEENVIEELGKTKTEDSPFLAEKENQALKTDLQKTRKDMLEEYLAVLLFKRPEIINAMAEEDKNIFSPRFAQILNYIKNNDSSFAKDNQEFGDFINYLSLKADVLPDINSEEAIENEFQCCLKELKMFEIKNKLEKICIMIKEAEEGKDFEKAQKLIEEFNCLSKSRCGLEAS